MASSGKCDFRELKEFQEKLQNLDSGKFNAFCESATKELAARLLRKVIKRTPVGDYSKEIVVVAKKDSKKHKKGESYTKKINPSGKVGGTLRRGWTAEKSVDDFMASIKVHHYGGTYVIQITNPVEYASYVEFGHRTRNHKGWVKGQFMLTISEQELRSQAPKILEKKLEKFLKEYFDAN